MFKIITPEELQQLTLEQLQALHRKLEEALANPADDRTTQRAVLASLANVRQAIGRRQAVGMVPRPRF